MASRGIKVTLLANKGQFACFRMVAHDDDDVQIGEIEVVRYKYEGLLGRDGFHAVGQVTAIGVNEEYQRQGVGTMLYEAAAKEAARRWNAPLASDDTRSYMAQAFWEKQVEKGRAEFWGGFYVLKNMPPATLGHFASILAGTRRSTSAARIVADVARTLYEPIDLGSVFSGFLLPNGTLRALRAPTHAETAHLVASQNNWSDRESADVQMQRAGIVRWTANGTAVDVGAMITHEQAITLAKRWRDLDARAIWVSVWIYPSWSNPFVTSKTRHYEIPPSAAALFHDVQQLWDALVLRKKKP